VSSWQKLQPVIAGFWANAIETPMRGAEIERVMAKNDAEGYGNAEQSEVKKHG
jgi:hypothetical protein